MNVAFSGGGTRRQGQGSKTSNDFKHDTKIHRMANAFYINRVDSSFRKRGSKSSASADLDHSGCKIFHHELLLWITLRPPEFPTTIR
jgi:hypothetical protein